MALAAFSQVQLFHNYMINAAEQQQRGKGQSSLCRILLVLIASNAVTKT